MKRAIAGTNGRPVTLALLDRLPLTDAQKRMLTEAAARKDVCPVCEDSACETKSWECGR